jgi:hypothetical protein
MVLFVLMKGIVFWILFVAGVAVQVFAPSLDVQDNKFVVPPEVVSDAKELRPAELVERERRIQWLSLGLTLSGAMGLAYHYRHLLTRRAE